MLTHAPCVLVIDDDAPIRISLSIVLTAVGYRVRSAMDGLSALAEMRKELPDILLSDLNMRGMSGFDLLEVVRRRFPEVRVIAMSSASFEADSLACLAADAFHQKGSNLLTLLKKLEAMVSVSMRFRSEAHAPIAAAASGRDDAEATRVRVRCPECQQEFSYVAYRSDSLVHHAECVHCRSVVAYAKVQNVIGMQMGDTAHAEA
jgi:CheY-like chemotaxis protein